MPGVVRIAGAGLAGLTAATILARGGRSVEVFEKKTRLLPSSGPHTEGVRNYRVLDTLDELRSHGFDLAPFGVVRRTVRHSPHHENVLHGAAYYLFMRGREPHTVDQSLYREARAAGARFHFGTAISPSEADIVATGPPQEAFNILGAGYTFGAEGSTLDTTTVHALFDNEVAPGGYLVITPGWPFHSVYSVSWRELDFERLLSRTERAFEISWIRAILGTSRWVGKIHGRAFFARNPYDLAVRGTTLYVGEAGGFQDAVAGFGFRYAVVSAALAARAVLEGADYLDLLKSVFKNEFRDAVTFRDALDQYSNEDFDKLVAALGPEITLEDYTRRRESRGF